LQAKPHVLAAHVGCAFDTGVVQTSRQVPQLLRSVVVSVHSVGIPVAGGMAGHAVSPAVQSNVHALCAHAARPVLGPVVGPGQVTPQPPQLPGSDVSSTHAVGAPVGHALKPRLHVKEHLLFAHVGCAFCTSFGQESPQPLQSLALLVVSTHVPLQSVGVAVGQPETQVPPEQTGSFVGHALVHEPQVAGLVMSVSQPSSGFESHWAQPAAHAEAGKTHCPVDVSQVVVPETCGRFVQSWPQVPQLWTSSGTHDPLHARSPVAQPGGAGSSPVPVSATLPASLPASGVGGSAPVSEAAVAS